MAKSEKLDLETHYEKHLASLWRRAPFALRITQWKDITGPVLVAKERIESGDGAGEAIDSTSTFGRQVRGSLVERGHLSGESQRRCLPVIRTLVERVNDDHGIPLELQRYLTKEGLRGQRTLPLDEEVGAKLCLLFKLQERINDMDRVELMARRIGRFTREEAGYWLSRISSYGEDANRWAISGLRLLIGGQPGDPAVSKMLERLRAK